MSDGSPLFASIRLVEAVDEMLVPDEPNVAGVEGVEQSFRALRRDLGREGKEFVSRDGIGEHVSAVLDQMQQDLFDRALAFREEHTHDIEDHAALTGILNGELGFVKAAWCGSEACETRVKDETTATIRVIPEEATDDPGSCAVCGADAHLRPVWARAY